MPGDLDDSQGWNEEAKTGPSSILAIYLLSHCSLMQLWQDEFCMGFWHAVVAIMQSFGKEIGVAIEIAANRDRLDAGEREPLSEGSGDEAPDSVGPKEGDEQDADPKDLQEMLASFDEDDGTPKHPLPAASAEVPEMIEDSQASELSYETAYTVQQVHDYFDSLQKDEDPESPSTIPKASDGVSEGLEKPNPAPVLQHKAVLLDESPDLEITAVKPPVPGGKTTVSIDRPNLSPKLTAQQKALFLQLCERKMQGLIAASKPGFPKIVTVPSRYLLAYVCAIKLLKAWKNEPVN